MTNNTLQTKSKYKTNLSSIFIVLALIFSGCAPASGDGEWASGEPDVPGSAPEAETPQEAEPPTAETPPAQEVPEVPTLPGVFFAFDPGIAQLANGPGKTWDGCESSALVRGGYDSDTKCGNGLVHPAYAEHLNRYFFDCVERASAEANYKQPERVFIRHWGTYVNRNARGSSSLSMHAYARAIDVVKFILYDRNGGVTQVSTHVRDFKGPTAVFYNSFRQCWKDSMPSACKPGQREYSGSIGIPGSALGGNSLHNDHIHLSFPFCAG